MMYFRLSVWPYEDGWCVSLAQMESTGRNRYPRVIQQPWKHTVCLDPEVTPDELFRRLRCTLWDLSRELPDTAPSETGSASLEGPQGGLDDPGQDMLF